MKQKLKTILLIDDDEATNFLNEMNIQNTEIAEQVVIAWNGKEALDYLTNTGMYANNGNHFPQPDLIFLDINMPVMDGWEFIKAYHALDENQKGKKVVVMLTTSINEDDRIKAATISEITNFKSKPLLPDDLMELVEAYFPDYF